MKEIYSQKRSKHDIHREDVQRKVHSIGLLSIKIDFDHLNWSDRNAPSHSRG